SHPGFSSAHAISAQSIHTLRLGVVEAKLRARRRAEELSSGVAKKINTITAFYLFGEHTTRRIGQLEFARFRFENNGMLQKRSELRTRFPNQFDQFAKSQKLAR